MDLKLDDYLTMDSKDLDKILVHVKNIVKLREKDAIEAIEKLDAVALEKSFEFNSKKRLPQKALDVLESNFSNIKIEQIDFYEYIITLPDFINNAERTKPLEEVLVRQSFYSSEFLDYCLKHDNLKSKLRDNWIYYDDVADIDKLVKEKVIEFNSVFTEHILQRNADVYIEYGKTHGLLTFNAEKTHSYYQKHCYAIAPSMMSFLEEHGNGCDGLSLAQLVQNRVDSVDTNQYHRLTLKDLYKEIIKTDSMSFNYLITHHQLDEQSLALLLTSYNNVFADNRDKTGLIQKIECLVHEFYQNYPQLTDWLNQAITTLQQPKAREAAKLVLEKQRLEHSISKEDMGSKKVKI